GHSGGFASLPSSLPPPEPRGRRSRRARLSPTGRRHAPFTNGPSAARGFFTGSCSRCRTRSNYGWSAGWTRQRDDGRSSDRGSPAVSTEKLAILVGGGPAPGINSVIGAATIRALLQGVEVLGVHHGLAEIMLGKVEGVRPLTIEDVSRIHFRGGSVLGTSRANPTTDATYLEAVVSTLQRL